MATRTARSQTGTAPSPTAAEPWNSEGGAFSGSYSAKSRFEEGEGTNPEELIAAAHAGCFSMALSLGLEQAGHPSESVSTTADVHLTPADGGFEISRIDLHTRATVPGIDARRVPAGRGGDEERLPGLQGARRRARDQPRRDAGVLRCAAMPSAPPPRRRTSRPVEDLFADDVTFRSPVVFKPYEGRDALKVLLGAVVQVFEDFRYIDQVETGDTAVLVFEARVGDASCRASTSSGSAADGRITELMVMVRPMSGVHAARRGDAAELERASGVGFRAPRTRARKPRSGDREGWSARLRPDGPRDRPDLRPGRLGRRRARGRPGRSSTRASAKIEKQLARAVEKGKIEQADADAVRGADRRHARLRATSPTATS